MGAKLLDSARSDSHADFALLLLNNLPNTAAFADVQPGGFGRAFMGYTTGPGTSEWLRVSHPQARPQSCIGPPVAGREVGELVLLVGIDLLRHQALRRPAVRRSYYSHVKQGATVGGSSGSAAVTPDGRIVGQLYGTCRTDDVDGSMKRVLPRIAPWITPPADCRPVTVQPNPLEPGRGTTTIQTPPNCGTLYRVGTNVRVLASPAPGYGFQLWSAGTVDAFARETHIVVPSNASPNVIAYFHVPPPPANDTCVAATQITVAPFDDERNTYGATTTGADPTPSCNDSRERNVSYRYNAPANNTVRITTAGSNYNTVTSVYAGNTCPVGAQAVACRQDFVNEQQELSFQAIAGTTYYIQVASANSLGGELHFRLEGLVANIPPVVTDGTLTGISGPVTATLDGSDRDNDPLLFSIISQPTKGIVSLVQPVAGYFTYVPQPGAVGLDTFTFRASDGKANSNTGTMTIGLTSEAAGSGATFTVNRTEDEMDVAVGNGVCLTASGGCSLRAAVLESHYATVPVTIVLPVSAQPYRLTRHGDPDINEYEHGDLDFVTQVSIVGAGAGASVIKQEDVERVIEVHATARVTISGVTIRGGNTIWKGAGIHNYGTLTLVRSLVTGNSTVHEGGGLNATGATLIIESTIADNVGDGGDGSGSGGGGIRNDGAMAIVNSTISGNRSDGPGGGIRNYGRLSIANSTIANNITRAGARGIDTWSEQSPALLLQNAINIDGCWYMKVRRYRAATTSTRATRARSAPPATARRIPRSAALVTLPSGLKLYELQAGSAAIDCGNPAGCARDGGELLMKDHGGRSRHIDGDGDGVGALRHWRRGSECGLRRSRLPPTPTAMACPTSGKRASSCGGVERHRRLRRSRRRWQDEPAGVQRRTHPRGFVTRYLAEGATGRILRHALALLNAAPTPGDRAAAVPHDRRRRVDSTSRRTIAPRPRDTIDRDERRRPRDAAILDDRSNRTRRSSVDRTMSVGRAADTAATPRRRSRRRRRSGISRKERRPADSSCSTCCRIRTRRGRAGDGAIPAAARPAADRADVCRCRRTSRHDRLTSTTRSPRRCASTDVSAVISTNAPIIVERAMYSNRPGRRSRAGHESAGVTAPALEWFLAEGATGPFFDLFMLIANPNRRPREVTRGLPAARAAARCTKTYTVPANEPLHDLGGRRGDPGRIRAAAARRTSPCRRRSRRPTACR